MSLESDVKRRLIADLSKEASDLRPMLNNGLRLLCKWRSVLIQNTLIANEGTKVLQGPLAGMDFIERSAEGCHIAKLAARAAAPSIFMQPCWVNTIKSSISAALRDTTR